MDTTLRVNLEPELVALVQTLNQPVQNAVRELVVLELYRRGTISSGKAGQLLGMSRWEFVRYSSRLGIAFFDMDEEAWEAERRQSEAL